LFLLFRGRLINNCSFVFVTGKDPKATILEILRREGPVPVYRLAKALGLSYGAIQWYIFSLEREGLVHTIKIGKRRYVALKTSDWFANVKVADVMEEFLLTLSTFGVKPDMTLREAIEVLEKKAPHIAELLRNLVEKT
jgi:DNA-binding transcriptional ArsR family regulator